MCSNWPMREPVHGKGEFKYRLFSSLFWLYNSLVLVVFLCTSSFRYVSGLCLLGYLVYMLAVSVLSRLVDNYQVPVVLLISHPSWFFASPKETTNLRFGNYCCSLLVAEISTWQLIMHQETDHLQMVLKLFSLFSSVEFLLSPISVRRWEQPIVRIPWTQVILIHTCFHDWTIRLCCKPLVGFQSTEVTGFGLSLWKGLVAVSQYVRSKETVWLILKLFPSPEDNTYFVLFILLIILCIILDIY